MANTMVAALQLLPAEQQELPVPGDCCSFTCGGLSCGATCKAN